MANVYIIICSLMALQSVAFCQDTNVTVSTSIGTFIGFQEIITIDDKVVKLSKFLGIPYAEPPIGQRRFKKPVMKAAMSDPMVTQQFSPTCIQVPSGIDVQPWSEDCLTLNIFAPETTIDFPFSVMIWIHGGGYVSGSADVYHADLLASRGDVVVVTINYRLGPLGFLNIGNGRESNFGLWDQHLAIRWVYNNIAAFGGDNSRVTIFGESAGAGSVVYQGLFPGNKGLFHRIIAESGSASSPWSETYNYKEEANKFAASVGCRYSDPDQVLICLRSLPSNALYDAVNNNDGFIIPIPFAPSIDGDFIKQTAKNTLNPKLTGDSAARRVFGTFDILVGMNAAEGAGTINPLYGVMGDPENFLPSRTTFEDTLVPFAIITQSLDDNSGLTKSFLIHMYTNWSNPEDSYEIRNNFVDMHGDISCVFPSLQTLDSHKKFSSKNTYMYYFTAKPSMHLLPTPSWIKTSNHGDELRYVFGTNFQFFQVNDGTTELTDWENDLSKNMMTMWTNFAKSGNPNLPTNTGVDWKQYSDTGREYLEIGKFINETLVKERLTAEKYNIWDSLLPAVHQSLNENCPSETSGTLSRVLSSPVIIVIILITVFTM